MKRNSGTGLTPNQAHYVIDRMVRERKLNQREIDRYLSEMRGEIQQLEDRLARLREASGATATAPRAQQTAPAAAAAPAAPGRKRRRRARAVPKEVMASRQLQGQYLSLIRQIPKERRPKFQGVALKEGREEAIKQMRDALRK